MCYFRRKSNRGHGNLSAVMSEVVSFLESATFVHA